MQNETINILERVSILYRKYGIKSVTMDDIAKELGISKKTLYRYFSDKQELVSKVIDFVLNQQQNCLADIHGIGLNSIDELFEMARHANQILLEHNPATDYDLKKYYPEEFQKIISVKRKVLYASILGNLQKGISEGIYRNEMNPEIIAKIHVARVEGMINNEVFSINELIDKKIFREIMIYHIRGISNEKGIKMLQEKLEREVI